MDKEDCGSVIYPDPEPRQAKGGVSRLVILT